MQKTTDDGKAYDLEGKKLIWHPEQFDDEPAIPDIRLPLRMKLKRLLDIGEGNLSTNEAMYQLIALVAPSQTDAVTEMDVNDFQDMFLTWRNEYNQATGASLGESSASPGSSANTEAPSNMTGGSVSVTA